MDLLPVLAVLILTNIGLGMYNKIGKEHIDFDKAKLISGIVKGAIVGFSAIALAFCADKVDLSSIGITPQLILNTAIITYAAKNLNNLAAVLGVQVNK